MTLKERARKLKQDVPAVFLALKGRDTPLLAKILAGVTVAYALSPIDLIPDFVPVLGYLDDVLLLPALIALTVKLIPKKVWVRCQAESENMWKDGKPKKWYFAIPVVLIWLLIDHAWGWEPCTVEAIKAYRPSTNSLGSGQVLHQPYTAEKAKLVLREMADSLVMDLVEKGLVTDQLVVTIGYDIENLTDPERRKKYRGDIVKDHYGRQIPKHAHGTANLDGHTSSTKKIMCAASELFDRIVDKNLLVRRLNIVANHVLPEADAPRKNAGFEQLDLFTDYAALEVKQEQERAELEREKKMQQAMLTIKKKFGKNAILKGMNLEEGATAKDRNAQIGGHKA